MCADAHVSTSPRIRWSGDRGAKVVEMLVNTGLALRVEIGKQPADCNAKAALLRQGVAGRAVVKMAAGGKCGTGDGAGEARS